MPRGASDAALLPYHVDRSKLFVMHRFTKIKSLDASRVANASSSHAFHHFMTRMMATVKTACWFAPPISSASSAIRITYGKPMLYIMNSKKLG